jgi:hypothetical protein
LAQGLADVVLSMENGKENVSGVFRSYLEAVFPFLKTEHEAVEKRMKEALKKETAKGFITFKPVADKFLKQKVKTMQLDEDFKQRLATKRRG